MSQGENLFVLPSFDWRDSFFAAYKALLSGLNDGCDVGFGCVVRLKYQAFTASGWITRGDSVTGALAKGWRRLSIHRALKLNISRDPLPAT
jgi:hypothetical protein